MEWALYFFTFCTGNYLNWSIWGPAIVCGVFAGSTPLTERLSTEKYPNYKIYQKYVSMLVPLPSRHAALVEELRKSVE